MRFAPTLSLPCLEVAIDRTQSELPPAFLQAGSFISLAPDCQGGVVLQKPFYTDFAGPGAAIGGRFDETCTAIRIIGTVKFQVLSTHAECQQALQARLGYIERLCSIASSPCALYRAALMLNQLCDWVGIYEASEIPPAWVAQLAGVQPKTIELAWKKYWQDCQMFATPA